VLWDIGLNRLSFGVQDFDSDVQQAVHRIQPAEQVFALVEAARKIGFKSLNVDLIYGLPKQNPQSFARTLEQVGELRPDRIALYGYAHLPERFKSQRRILRPDLPTAGTSWKCFRQPLIALSMQVMCTWGWTTSPCRTMPWRLQTPRALAPQLSRL